MLRREGHQAHLGAARRVPKLHQCNAGGDDEGATGSGAEMSRTIARLCNHEGRLNQVLDLCRLCGYELSFWRLFGAFRQLHAATDGISSICYA